MRLLLLRTNVALDDIHVTHVRVTSRSNNLSNIDAPFASPPFASPPFVFSIPERPPEQVGNFLFQQNMDKVEMKTHFALWSVMGSPLILGEREN